MRRVSARLDEAGGNFEALRALSDAELERTLAEADDVDERLQAGDGTVAVVRPRHDVEVVFLGALGCRLGMLAGGAGGLLVTMHGTTMLIDPGPGALSRLVRLDEAGTFSFASLNAILCTHLHPDHVTDLLPCIEGMLAGRALGAPRTVAGNVTVVERFRALSPYHFRSVQTEILVAGGPPVVIGSVSVSGTPTKHMEEAGREHTGVGFLLTAGPDTVWYSGDTTLCPDLLTELGRHASSRAVTIANADASDIARRPGRAEMCHLLTRDIPVISEVLRPPVFVVQHYDKAYAGVGYRAAQATYAQREVSRAGLDTLVLFAGDGLRLGFESSTLVAADSVLAAPDGAEATAFAIWSRNRHDR